MKIGLKGRGIWSDVAFHKEFIEKWCDIFCTYLCGVKYYDEVIINMRVEKLNKLI
jgi:hypothetical protein